MNMKRFSIISLLLWIGILAFASGKPKVMWLDCSANFQRFSYPDSIRYYVDKYQMRDTCFMAFVYIVAN